MNARVEPEWAMLALVFVDIRGFTAFADRSTAREAVAYLNEFFRLVVPILTEHGGHADGELHLVADRAGAERADQQGPVQEGRLARLPAVQEPGQLCPLRRHRKAARCTAPVQYGPVKGAGPGQRLKGL